MTTNELKHMTELALIRSIPDLMIVELKPGRLKNLMSRLQAAVDIDIAGLVRTTNQIDIDKIESVLEEFKIVAKFGKQKHVGTVASFCLALVDESENPFNQKITDNLNLVCDYYERVGDLHVASMWAGDMAFKRWNSIFEDK